MKQHARPANNAHDTQIWYRSLVLLKYSTGITQVNVPHY